MKPLLILSALIALVASQSEKINEFLYKVEQKLQEANAGSCKNISLANPIPGDKMKSFTECIQYSKEMTAKLMSDYRPMAGKIVKDAMFNIDGKYYEWDENKQIWYLPNNAATNSSINGSQENVKMVAYELDHAFKTLVQKQSGSSLKRRGFKMPPFFHPKPRTRNTGGATDSVRNPTNADAAASANNPADGSVSGTVQMDSLVSGNNLADETIPQAEGPTLGSNPADNPISNNRQAAPNASGRVAWYRTNIARVAMGIAVVGLAVGLGLGVKNRVQKIQSSTTDQLQTFPTFTVWDSTATDQSTKTLATESAVSSVSKVTTEPTTTQEETAIEETSIEETATSDSQTQVEEFITEETTGINSNSTTFEGTNSTTATESEVPSAIYDEATGITYYLDPESGYWYYWDSEQQEYVWYLG